MAITSLAQADMFGTGANQFTIDFVPISGDASSANGTNISYFTSGDWRYREFTDPGSSYRMGVYEVTNDQWEKFRAELGVPVMGTPSNAYDRGFRNRGTGTTNVPTNNASWYEAAQMVNWLNTSTGHQAAYRFTGTQGTGDYTFAIWSPADAAGGTNRYRHKDAFYFLPTEDEWVKAAYWNGTTLQDYATKAGESLTQGDGTSGTGWNYWDDNGGYATDPRGPWDVGSGSEELNGTYDMMGNIWEWMETPYSDTGYSVSSPRGWRGGYWGYVSGALHASFRYSDPTHNNPANENPNVGFRVASIPEPGSIALLICGALAGLIWWRRRR